MKSLEQSGFSAQQITALSWLCVAFAVIFCAVVIALYLLNALALYKISKKRGVCASRLAFLPVVNSVTVEGIVGRECKIKGKLYVAAALLKSAVAIWCVISFKNMLVAILPLAEAAAESGEALLSTQIMPVINNLWLWALFVILAVAKKVLYLLCFNEILCSQGIEKPLRYTLICIPFGFLAPVFLYSASKREVIDEQ